MLDRPMVSRKVVLCAHCEARIPQRRLDAGYDTCKPDCEARRAEVAKTCRVIYTAATGWAPGVKPYPLPKAPAAADPVMEHVSAMIRSDVGGAFQGRQSRGRGVGMGLLQKPR